MSTPRDHEHLDLGVPDEEDVDAADAAARLDEDPDDVGRNREEPASIDLHDTAGPDGR